MQRLLSDKVSKDDLKLALPNIKAIRFEIDEQIKATRGELLENLSEKYKALEGKIVTLRKDTNVEHFKHMLGKKADLDSFTAY